MSEIIDFRAKHDERARELGFKNRHEMRSSIHMIAEEMTEEEYNNLSDEEMEKKLRDFATKIKWALE